MNSDAPAPFWSRLIDRLADPKIVFFALPYLMLLLAAGTVAQKEMGLYAATRLFFSSWVIWLGPLPLPGLYPVTALIALALFTKLIFKSAWSRARAGTIVVHAGVLVLLCGGLLTALTQKEGYMLIPEGESRSAVEDYHSRVLTVARNGETILTLPHTALRDGMTIGAGTLPFSLTILHYALNNEPLPQDRDSAPEGLPWHGPAAKVRLAPRPADKQDENNHAGLTLLARGAGAEQDGGYLLTELMPHRPEIVHSGDTYTLSFARAETRLPFSLALTDITRDLHPGTQTARAYRAALVITDGDASWPVEIGMNEPLRYRGYTFYQSSYIATEAGEATVLSVVRNSGRLFPYAASALIAAGLLLHILMRVRVRAAALALLLAGAMLTPAAARAESLPMTEFSRLAIQDQGRLKPLGAFAAATLRQLSGSERFEGQPAVAWLAQSLFDPAVAAENRVLRVPSPALRALLALPERKDRLYTLGETSSALAQKNVLLETLAGKPAAALNQTERDLILLRDNVALYLQLLRSFSLILPLAVDVPAPWDGGGAAPSYLALEKHREEIDRRLQNLIRRKGENIERYSAAEKKLAALGWQMQMLRAGGADNTLLRILPPQWHEGAQGEEWLAPWDALLQGRGGPGSAALLQEWAGLAAAWANSDAQGWDRHVAAIRAGESLGASAAWRLALEDLYHRRHPAEAAFTLYIVLLVAAAGYAFVPQRRRRAALAAMIAAGVAALAVHSALLLMRIVILARPPVGTLYESILFVSFLCAGAAFGMGWARKNPALLAISGFTGAALLLLSAYFAQVQGDTMVMLTAVLNTGFWLSTHVLFITAGYAFAVLAACLAHLHLARACRGRTPSLAGTMPAALWALFFAATGTILGGIWADQSWGRFWGWDPKENGALLIVLWLVWLLHGRVSGMIAPVPALAVLAALNIVVALSWFGVNLLNVGLHSYGFTEGIAAGLAAFCLLEAVLIAGLWLGARRCENVR